MTIPSTSRNRLPVLEERRAAARPWRPVREITDDMSIAEIQDEWARTLAWVNFRYTKLARASRSRTL
jgi:hypothetical protein